MTEQQSDSYDVIVVGAGPSGSTAAFVLAGAGYRVALVDKSRFPRDKLCGGGLTGRSKKVFESVYAQDWDDVLEYQSRGIAFYHKQEYLNRLDDYKSFDFIYRYDFDHYLARKAETAGAVFMQGIDITDISHDGTRITLRDGSELHTDYLIGADGIKSIVARKALSRQFDRDQYAIAMEAEVDREHFSRNVDVPEIYYGLVDWGYGWVFPKNDRLTIGLAGLYRYNSNIRQQFTDFLRNDLAIDAEVKMQGFYLPFGHYSKRPGRANILLVGDAAGLVDPITGEGIAFAMQSGQLAAEAVMEASRLQQPQAAYKIYRKKLKAITRIIRQANYVKHLIYGKFTNRLLIRGLATSTNKHSIRLYMDLLADEISYLQYIRQLFRKSGARILRLLVN